MDDLLAEFVTEAGESLAELDAALLKLEQAPGDAETLGRMFRLVQIDSGRNAVQVGECKRNPNSDELLSQRAIENVANTFPFGKKFELNNARGCFLTGR